jgi:hypothetical protein
MKILLVNMLKTRDKVNIKGFFRYSIYLSAYTCQLSGIKIKIALLFEHKSSPDNNLQFQLHRYMGNLWENSIYKSAALISRKNRG